ncbi:MAG TPA: pyroglutamyl-peptidase I [Chloroflexota bacterium]|nr:pyroglutamyl-peptidase I [Chloroflexota bacterium]
MTMRVLLTGFEPFLQWTVNPSAEVVTAIEAQPPDGVELRSKVLPVVFAEAGGLLRREIDAFQPDVVLMLGLGGGSALRFERVGVNLDDLPGRKDNRGESPEQRPIDPEGPAAYFSTLPVRRLVRHLREHGVPASESLSAGTFLCNHVLYAALRHCALTGIDAQVGFIHLPQLPELAAETPGREPGPSMALETQVRGVRLALELLAGGDG